MLEKQKTCITVIGRGVALTQFTSFINIPHKVDIIRVRSIGGEVYNDPGAGSVLVDEAFYVTTDMVTNTHDQILGIFGNLSYHFSNSNRKDFMHPSKKVSGTYTFTLYQLNDGLINTYNRNASVYINLEFIELDSNDSILNNIRNERLTVK